MESAQYVCLSPECGRVSSNPLQTEWAECEALSEYGARSPSLIASLLNINRERLLDSGAISSWLSRREKRPAINRKTYAIPHLISEYQYFLYAKRGRGAQHPRSRDAIEKEIQRVEPPFGLITNGGNYLQDKTSLLRRKFYVLSTCGGALFTRLISTFLRTENGKRRNLKQLHLALHTRTRKLSYAYITFLHRKRWKSDVTYVAKKRINKEIGRIMRRERSLNLHWVCSCHNA